MTALELSLEVSQLDQGIEPLAEKLQALAPGRYEVTTDGLLRPGLWQFHLDVLINDFEAVTFETKIGIGG